MKNYLKTYFFDIIFKKFFNSTGRANRKEYWLFIFNLLIFFSLLFLFVYFDSPYIVEKIITAYPNYDTLKIYSIFLSLIMLFSFLLLWPFINLLVRRLHDIGLSAAWLVLLIFLRQYALIVVLIIGFVPGKKEKNKYDNQDTDKNVIKKNAVNIIIFFILSFLIFILSLFPISNIRRLNQMESEANLIINKIAQAEFKCFSENFNFLSVDRDTSNDTLNIDMQDYKFFGEFCCIVNNDNIDNKSVEIKVWSKIDDKQKGKFKDSYYSSYICATQYQNGELSKMILKLEKKAVE